MFEAVNAGWMDLGVEGTEHVAGTTSARDVFAAAQKSRDGVNRDALRVERAMGIEPTGKALPVLKNKRFDANADAKCD